MLVGFGVGGEVFVLFVGGFVVRVFCEYIYVNEFM